MGSFRFWTTEIWFAVGLMFCGLCLGLIFDKVFETLFIVSFLYLIWHFYQIAKLKQWLTGSRTLYPPESRGIWGDIFYHIYLLKKYNRISKKKLNSVLQEFRSSTAALPEGAVALSSSSEIIWFNRSAEELLGINSKLDVGQRITNLIRTPPFIEYLEKGDYSFPVEIISPVDERIRLSCRVTSYNRNQKLLIARNITRLYQLEQVRKDFVANVSHELRTPLTVVTGYIEIMGDHKDSLPVAFQKPIDQVTRQVTRMRNLVDDLLILSKLESENTVAQRAIIHPHRILKVVSEEAKALSAGNHKVKFLCRTDEPIVGNEKEMLSVFTNLIQNAIRHTPKGSSVTIEWKKIDDKLEMSVTDTGDGIESIHLPRLTERFYRIDDGRDRAKGGTGLGLAIVKHILERHESKLEITSVVGNGSRFFCQFYPASKKKVTIFN